MRLSFGCGWPVFKISFRLQGMKNMRLPQATRRCCSRAAVFNSQSNRHRRATVFSVTSCRVVVTLTELMVSRSSCWATARCGGVYWCNTLARGIPRQNHRRKHCRSIDCRPAILEITVPPRNIVGVFTVVQNCCVSCFWLGLEFSRCFRRASLACLIAHVTPLSHRCNRVDVFNDSRCAVRCGPAPYWKTLFGCAGVVLIEAFPVLGSFSQQQVSSDVGVKCRGAETISKHAGPRLRNHGSRPP